MQRIILPRDIDVVVTSFGGVGTSFLLDFISKYKKTNHRDSFDDMKHSPLPPISFNTKVKFVYIYGDPRLAVISLFRRNSHYGHPLPKTLQRWFNRATIPIPKEMTLEEYCAIGIDRFYFRDQFLNLYCRYTSAIPTLFIRYETLFDNLEPLFDFLDIPRNNMDRFPKKRLRA